MNKDLDPRIIPVGEYFDAINVLVSRSETGDVGAVESIQGNTKASSFNTDTDYGYVIGYCLDSENDCVYYFTSTFRSYLSATRMPDTSSDRCAIIKQSFKNISTEVLFESHNLNFDKDHPITGANIIDGYLFFTDNRNQPRVFNTNNPSAYVDNSTSDIRLEDQLSVAKYAPVCAPELLQPKYIVTVNGSIGSRAVVNGAVTNSANVSLAGNLSGTTIAAGMTVTGPGITTTVTVQTVNSQSSIVLSSAQTIADGAVLIFGLNTLTLTAANSGLQTDFGAGTKFKVLDGDNPLSNISNSYNNIPDDVVVTNISGTTLTVNKPIFVVDKTELTLLCSSMIDNSSNDADIDVEFLKEKFVRFSYRFRFNDNTYSLMAPFSQIAFIPAIATFDATSQINAFKETEVENFVNSINQLELKINLPYEYPSTIFIKEVEILMKESDSVAVKVVDKIDVSTSAIINNTLRKDATTITFGKIGNNKLQAYISNIYKRRHELYYVYRSTDAYKTLPENQTTRVFDNVPNKALAQEMVSNRIVYGNFIQGKPIPKALNFEIAVGTKAENDEFTYEEYPRHTLKQDRTYSVGVVLADRYGRQSPVILSSNSNSQLHRRSSLQPPGDCLKIIFNEKISENLYNVETNKLGWYSYKIVVQQKEQEYYNVYTPGATLYNRNVNGDGFSYFPIFGDNINKIPRDEITEGAANAALRLASSSVQLDDIVENGDNTIQVTNRNVIAIGELSDFITEPADRPSFYEPEKNYLFAQIKGNIGVGAEIPTGSGGVQPFSNIEGLTVFETKPFKSKLDIFYETSTCGLISDLNAKIDASDGGVAPGDLKLRDLQTGNTDKNDFNESEISGAFILRLRVFDNNGVELTYSANQLSINITNITCSGRGNVSNVFSAERDGVDWKLKLQNAQEYLLSPSDEYTLTFEVTSTQGNNNFTKTVQIKNVVPNLAFKSGVTCLSYTAGTTGILTQVNNSTQHGGLKIIGLNGSGSTTANKNNLADSGNTGTTTYFYSKVSGDSRVTVDRDGTIKLTSSIAANETNISFVLRVTDIGGLTYDLDPVPLCLSPADTINIGEGTCPSGSTKYNYYSRCYGSNGSQDPGDSYDEYFCPANLTYSSITNHCNGNYEDVATNNTSVNTTMAYPSGTNAASQYAFSERFTQVWVGGKAYVNGAVSSSVVNIDGHSTGFVVEVGMRIEGTGIGSTGVNDDGTHFVGVVNSQNQIIVHNASGQAVSVSLANNAVLTFGKKVLDATWDGTGGNPNYANQIDHFFRPGPHGNDTPGFAGYVGANNEPFIVTIGNIDYEVIIGGAGHSGLYSDPDNGYPGVRKLVKRSSIVMRKSYCNLNPNSC